MYKGAQFHLRVSGMGDVTIDKSGIPQQASAGAGINGYEVG